MDLPFGEVRWSSGASVTDFGFTGQRNESGFGLMDYNARFYSSQLGRFTQADTVVPNPGNPMAFDRYAYAYNNPSRFTDPSGHECFDTGSGQYCTDDPDSYEELGLTFTNPVSFKERPKYSGEDMLWLYEQYRDAPNAWWNDDPLLGGDPDGFTVTDFFILILYFEMAGNTVREHASNQNMYAYAISQKYSYECARYSSRGFCSEASDTASLNYLAIRGSAQMRYDSVKNGTKPSELDPRKVYDLNVGVAVVKHALKSVSRHGSQADWGNDETTGAFYWTGPTGPPGILYGPPLNPPMFPRNPNLTVAQQFPAENKTRSRWKFSRRL